MNPLTETGFQISKSPWDFPQVHMDEDAVEGGNTELISNNTLPIYCCKTCNMACLSMNSFNTHTCRLPTDDENTSSVSQSYNRQIFSVYFIGEKEILIISNIAFTINAPAQKEKKIAGETLIII